MIASCKDCVHADMCRFYTEELAKAKGITLGKDIFEYFSSGDVCEDFKDRARFVEMPFQLGDDVYCTRMFKIHKKTVKKIELDDEGIAIITEDGYCFDSSICFRSQKEAEQALKEREKNAN